MNALVVVYGLVMIAAGLVGFVALLRWDVRVRRDLRDLERRIAAARAAAGTTHRDRRAS